MLENKLTFRELSEVVQPILRLDQASAITAAFQNVFQVPIAKPDDIVCQNRILITYRDYRLDIRDFRYIAGKGFSIHLQFKSKQRWWHGFRDQNRLVVRDLEAICRSEISDLQFARFETQAPPDPWVDGPFKLILLHDSRAFNREWIAATDISPLLIAPDAHNGNCFVEFHFNPGGYRREGAHTILRDDWLNSATDVSEAIQRDANRLLGISS
jgi:hypothetical protein